MSEDSSGGSIRRPSEVLHSDEDTFAPICREFFVGWQKRNGWLREHWNLDAVKEVPPMATSLDMKLLHLKREIGFLVDQDTSLFKQLFELHEAMEELKEKLECECCFMSDESSETSSISSDQELPDSPGGSSPNTSTSTLSYRTSDSKPQPRRSLVHHTSFVRQRVSYPPSARNRYSRAKGRPSHHSQGSYDSGIHTPDHEIFV